MQFFATQKYVPGSRKTSHFLHIMLLTGTPLHVQGDRNSPSVLGHSLQSAQEQGPRETTKTLEISAKVKIYISPKSREGGKTISKDSFQYSRTHERFIAEAKI